MSHPKKKDDLLQDVIERAGSDPAFRSRLLADPAAAIRHAFGVILPHDYRIRFIDQPAELDALVVLPPADGRLDEDDLEQVAGGADTDPEICSKW